MMKLDDKQKYPWRDSMTDKARCACCVHYKTDFEPNEAGYDFGIFTCLKKRELVYPLYCGEHDCQDFVFKPAEPIRPTPFNQCEYIECETCSHNLLNICDGKQWIPVRIKGGKCEFWRDAKLTCKFAIPYHQYIGGYRNNYCRLEPKKRDGDAKQGWKWNCYSAHQAGVERLKCYCR